MSEDYFALIHKVVLRYIFEALRPFLRLPPSALKTAKWIRRVISREEVVASNPAWAALTKRCEGACEQTKQKHNQSNKMKPATISST